MLYASQKQKTYLKTPLECVERTYSNDSQLMNKCILYLGINQLIQTDEIHKLLLLDKLPLGLLLQNHIIEKKPQKVETKINKPVKKEKLFKTFLEKPNNLSKKPTNILYKSEDYNENLLKLYNKNNPFINDIYMQTEENEQIIKKDSIFKQYSVTQIQENLSKNPSNFKLPKKHSHKNEYYAYFKPVKVRYKQWDFTITPLKTTLYKIFHFQLDTIAYMAKIIIALSLMNKINETKNLRLNGSIIQQILTQEILNQHKGKKFVWFSIYDIRTKQNLELKANYDLFRLKYGWFFTSIKSGETSQNFFIQGNPHQITIQSIEESTYNSFLLNEKFMAIIDTVEISIYEKINQTLLDFSVLDDIDMHKLFSAINDEIFFVFRFGVNEFIKYIQSMFL